jgi:hypothetical protein
MLNFFSFGVNFVDSIAIGIETLLVIIFSVLFFLEQLREEVSNYIYLTEKFWVILGFLIYLTGSFFIYLYADNVSKKELRHFWYITFILNTIKNIFFFIGLYLTSKIVIPNHKLN